MSCHLISRNPSYTLLHPLIHLDDHLSYTLSTQRLTALKRLSLKSRQRIENRRNQQKNRRSDQTRRVSNQAQPLNQAHDSVDRRAHVVRLEASDEGVEGRGGRADAQEEGDFDEDEDEGGDAGLVSVCSREEIGRAAVQEKHAPQNDDIKVEDVCYSKGEAEDDAEDAGPVGVYVLAMRFLILLEALPAWQGLHHCRVFVPLTVYAYEVPVSTCACYRQVRGSSLKLRDLNSSAIVMVGASLRA